MIIYILAKSSIIGFQSQLHLQVEAPQNSAKLSELDIGILLSMFWDTIFPPNLLHPRQESLDETAEGWGAKDKQSRRPYWSISSRLIRILKVRKASSVFRGLCSFKWIIPSTCLSGDWTSALALFQHIITGCGLRVVSHCFLHHGYCGIFKNGRS